jgi:hypothetical protein
MNNLFLGIIAASVLVMAVLQVYVLIVAARAAERFGALAATIERDIRPIMANVQAVTSDAARATALAVAQVERVDRVTADLTARLEQILTVVQTALVGATGGGAWMSGLKMAIAAFRSFRKPTRRSRHVEDEDALFIG